MSKKIKQKLYFFKRKTNIRKTKSYLVVVGEFNYLKNQEEEKNRERIQNLVVC
jgi:hypothetical protein